MLHEKEMTKDNLGWTERNKNGGNISVGRWKNPRPVPGYHLLNPISTQCPSCPSSTEHTVDKECQSQNFLFEVMLSISVCIFLFSTKQFYKVFSF